MRANLVIVYVFKNSSLKQSNAAFRTFNYEIQENSKFRFADHAIDRHIVGRALAILAVTSTNERAGDAIRTHFSVDDQTLAVLAETCFSVAERNAIDQESRVGSLNFLR